MLHSCRTFKFNYHFIGLFVNRMAREYIINKRLYLAKSGDNNSFVTLLIVYVYAAGEGE